MGDIQTITLSLQFTHPNSTEPLRDSHTFSSFVNDPEKISKNKKCLTIFRVNEKAGTKESL